MKGRDRTKLVDAMFRQVEAVRGVLGPGSTVPIHPVVCFVDGMWPLLRRRPLCIRGVTIVWPDALATIVTKEVEAPLGDPSAIAAHIAGMLRAA